MGVLYEVGRALSLLELARDNLRAACVLIEMHGGNRDYVDEISRSLRESEREFGSGVKAWLLAAKLLKQAGK